MRGDADDVRKIRMRISPIGGGEFVLRLYAGLSQEICISRDAGDLSADGRKSLSIGRAENHVANRRTCWRIPFQIDMAFVARSSQVGRRRQSGSNRVVVHAN